MTNTAFRITREPTVFRGRMSGGRLWASGRRLALWTVVIGLGTPGVLSLAKLWQPMNQINVFRTLIET